MKILITGGSGFFGEHLAARCRMGGADVRILDRIPSSLTDIDFQEGDVRNAEDARRACDGVDVVIHNAALVPISKAGHEFWEVNVDGTRVMLDAARSAGVKKFIFISSSSVFGAPEGSEAITEETPLAPFEEYGKSKAAAEALCQEAKRDLDISIIRPRTIMGNGRMGLLSLIFDWIASNRSVYILGPGTNKFQFVSARDLAEAVWRASTVPCCGEDFNVGAKQFDGVRQDLEELIRRVGSRSRVVSVPSRIAKAILPFLGTLRLSPFVSYHYHVADRTVYFSGEKTARILGFVPQDSNADMLEETYRWYLAHTDEARRGSSIHQKKLSAGIFKLLRYLP